MPEIRLIPNLFGNGPAFHLILMASQKPNPIIIIKIIHSPISISISSHTPTKGTRCSGSSYCTQNDEVIRWPIPFSSHSQPTRFQFIPQITKFFDGMPQSLIDISSYSILMMMAISYVREFLVSCRAKPRPVRMRTRHKNESIRSLTR